MSQPGKFLSQSEKEERRLGGILFWVMNLLIFVTLYFASLISLPHPEILIVIPWLINLSFLAITFWKKPQMTIGYLLGATLVVGLGLLLGAWAFVSCLISLPFLITGPGVLLAWLIIFMYGTFKFLGDFVWYHYQMWWTDGQYLPPKRTIKKDSTQRSEVDLSGIFANYETCPKCHTDNNQNEVYCSNCGFYLRHRIQK